MPAIITTLLIMDLCREDRSVPAEVLYHSASVGGGRSLAIVLLDLKADVPGTHYKFR
jgi:hypothetical protein